MCFRVACLLLLALGGCSLHGAAADATSQVLRFESNILPLFKRSCLPCHSSASRQAGLSLESRDDALNGGKTGAAVVPGRPNDSLLLSMIASGKMPMGAKRLSDEELHLVRRWIESGALRTGEQIAASTISEREILYSILGAKCFVCHGRRMQEGGLDLRTRTGMLKGGKSGPAIMPGKPEESLLVKRIAAQQMPPPDLQEQFSVRGLTDEELAKLKAWIAAGALSDGERPPMVTAATDPLVKPKDRDFWSFRPPRRPPIPAVSNAKIRNPIDAFVLAKLRENRLGFSEEASALTLMRRAYLDLTGLPPTPEEIDSYQKDVSPGAYERLIDRLLNSPRYGERWARYWLDAAGYADSEGAVSADNVRPFAWRYRDYVIRSLNADKPYDQFLIEQIAGDELFDYKAVRQYTRDQADKLVATGFLRLAPDSTYSTEQNFIPERFDTVAAEMEVLSSAVLGMTIGCARCHDHKYDPIPQRDYYRLSSNLQTAYDPYDWLSPSLKCIGVGAKCDDSSTRYLPLPDLREQQEVEEHNRPLLQRIAQLEKSLESKAEPLRERLRANKLEKLPEEVRRDLQAALDTTEPTRTALQKYLVTKLENAVNVTSKELETHFDDYRKEAEKLRREVAAEKAKLKPLPKIRALFDMPGDPTPNRILLRGDFTNPGPLVEPGVPSVLEGEGVAPYRREKLQYSSGTSGRRLALARWLTQTNHPLTSRVMVNRIWQHHFASGLVVSPGNFGRTGPAPSHPELLDWLATEFVRQGWSVKAMHRLIMTSAVYRQSSHVDALRQEADSDNRLLSRFPLRRLDAEALRDSILGLADRLDLKAFGPPAEITVNADGEVVDKPPSRFHRRSIYLMQRRSKPITLLESFDAPQLAPNCLRRRESTVSSQALHLMNSELVREASRYMAGRVIDSVGNDPGRQVERAYISVLTRVPDAAERTAAEQTLRQLTSAWRQHLQREKPAEPVEAKAGWLALAAFCHTMINSAEFLYID